MSGLIERMRRFLVPEQRRTASGGTIGFGSAGAVSVNAQLVENLSTVQACVGAIGSTIGSLPAFVYRRAAAGRVEAPDHPVAALIHAPNAHQTWPDWMEMTLAQALLHGNALSVIEADREGKVTGLVPVPWQNVMATLLPNGRLAYDVVQFVAPWGGTGQPRRYLADEVFHLRDRTDDGYLGRSRLSRSPAVLANAMALQEHANTIWTNAATPSGLLKTEGTLSVEAGQRLRASWDNVYSGSRNSGKTLVLEQGLSWEPISVSPEDAEVLASRRFTVEELCRLYQVPPPIVQDYTHGTFTNTAQAALWFAQLSLSPWVRKIEAEFARSVFGEGSEYHLEIDLSGLMRGDYAARWAAYGVAIDKGILSADEIREAEGYNPRADAPTPAPVDP